MFRIIVEEISKSLLPPVIETFPDKHTRFNLQPRRKWLFDNGKLPEEVGGLAGTQRRRDDQWVAPSFLHCAGYDRFTGCLLNGPGQDSVDSIAISLI